MSIYYEPSPVYDAIINHLGLVKQGTQSIPAMIDEPEFKAPQLIVEPVTSPEPVIVTMGGPAWAVLQFQVVTVMPSRQAARKTGDRVRYILAGLDNKGQLIHPIAGLKTRSVASMNDGHLDTDGRTSTWTETYRIEYVND